MALKNYYLPETYSANVGNSYFLDKVAERQVHQPDAYGVADYLCRSAGRDTVVDLGCGSGRKLTRVTSAKRVVGIDHGQNLHLFRTTVPHAAALEVDLETISLEDVPRQVWNRCVVICSDVIEHLVNPEPLVDVLVALADRGAIVVLTTPDRARLGQSVQMGPPANPAHVREWTLDELASYLRSRGAAVAFEGHTLSDNLQRYRGNSMLVLDASLSTTAAPIERPLGVVATYNDADCVVALSELHLAEGIDLWFVDNWSTDGTFDKLLELKARFPERVQLERFPAAGPEDTYSWIEILRRKEEIALGFPGRWILHIDSDEHRSGPWPGITLAEALSRAEGYGANCVDFCVVEFPPTKDGFSETDDPLSFFERYKFAMHIAHFAQRRAWIQPNVRIDLAGTGGHEAAFAGRRVFPYRFYLGHYPLRSTAQARRKVLQDRKTRYTHHERDVLGWHNHYDNFGRDTVVIRWDLLYDPFDFKTFRHEMMPEIISDVVWQRCMGSLNW